MEHAWSIIMAVLAASLPTLFLVLFIYSYARKLWRKYFVTEPESLPIDRRDAALKRSSLMASLWRSSLPLRAFQWSEHPSHVITALEHGWAAFSFSYAASATGAFATPVHQMWEMCNSCSAMKFCAPEISWMSNGPGECLQQIRLNPGLRSSKDGCVLPVQALQTALPLPGPVLGPCPYPQDAYFELCILASGNELSSEYSSLAGSERVKLIAQALTSERYQRGQSLTEFNDVEFCRKLDTQLKGHADLDNEKNLSSKHLTAPKNEQEGDLEHSSEVDQIDWDELLSVGLAGAEAPPFRLLGFDPGSVGFLSADGQCYVNGMPHLQGKDLVPTKGRPWGTVKTTVGCGFDPRVKRVYFTINGELVHEALLKSADFSNPLYPTIASNYDVTVLINLGQKSFEYAPANITRVANPCCRILQARPSKNGSFFDDDLSSDLFSMGRFDSQWLSDLEYTNTQELHRHDHSEAESDLFEIVLDGHSLKR